MNLLLFISLLVEFIEGTLSTKIRSQYTWVWQPYAAPGIMYDKIQSPANGDLKGAQCIDMCLQLLKDGTAWCRYVLLDPYQGEWDKVVPGVHTFVERMSSMVIKDCFLFTHQKISEELSKKYYLSKGFQNKADGHVGTYVILELVTTAYNSIRWPDNLQIPVPTELRYADKHTEQYFTNTKACPWNSKMLQQSSVSTPSFGSTSTTPAPSTSISSTVDSQTNTNIIQYTILCDEFTYHFLESTICPGTTVEGEVLYTNEFSKNSVSGCNMLAITDTQYGAKLTEASDTTAKAWCSKTKGCGFNVPLYWKVESIKGTVVRVYKTDSSTSTNLLCYVYSSNKG